LRELRALRKHPKLVKLSEATPGTCIVRWLHWSLTHNLTYSRQLGCQSQCEQIVGAWEEVCLSWLHFEFESGLVEQWSIFRSPEACSIILRDKAA
jgi:hypothetical protein